MPDKSSLIPLDVDYVTAGPVKVSKTKENSDKGIS
jgi:thiamine monophosphate synthase